MPAGKTPSGWKKHDCKELRNFKKHWSDLEELAQLSPPKARQKLREATPEFIEALSTACRVLDGHDYEVKPRDERRFDRMCSRLVSKRNKRVMVCGPPTGTSRGRGFFQGIARGVTALGSDPATDTPQPQAAEEEEA